jgi:S-(hydroxymethyl)glutathione dehydrogenase/alcohol dehydrogenase
MRTRAAVLWERNVDWLVEDIELDPPRTREVVVELAASGLWQSRKIKLDELGPAPTRSTTSTSATRTCATTRTSAAC